MNRNLSHSKSIFLMKAALISYLITVFMLLLLSFLMLKAGVSGTFVSIALILIYILAPLAGGFYTGKHVDQKKYVWGLLAAVIYFCIYLFLSLAFGGETAGGTFDYIKTGAIILFSGTLGGMIS